jgi:hypothetical protein
LVKSQKSALYEKITIEESVYRNKLGKMLGIICYLPFLYKSNPFKYIIKGFYDAQVLLVTKYNPTSNEGIFISSVLRSGSRFVVEWTKTSTTNESVKIITVKNRRFAYELINLKELPLNPPVVEIHEVK